MADNTVNVDKAIAGGKDMILAGRHRIPRDLSVRKAKGMV
jgi:hypothetical protein